MREQTVVIRPPRALWVPFILGRPFGVPHDPAFQRRVLEAVLALFERASGPVLEDYPEEAPADPADAEGYACPVSFARAPADESDVAQSLLGEIAQLGVWYDLARKRRSRTTVGISAMPVEDAARFIGDWIATSAAPPTGQSQAPPVVVLKRACDDLKAYYFEAVAAQPGNLSAGAINDWFWRDTAAARAFIELRAVCMRDADPQVRAVGQQSLVPQKIVRARGLVTSA